MAPCLTLGLRKAILILPCSAHPGKFLSNYLAFSVPRWHDIPRLLGSEVDISRNLQDDL